MIPTVKQSLQVPAEATEVAGAGCAAPSGSDEERLRTLTKELRELHASAENAKWDGGTHNAKAKMEAFSVAAWNHVPWILDKLDQLRKLADALAINADAALKFAKRTKEELRNREAMGIECAEEADQWKEVATALAESCKLVRHGTPGMGEALRNYEALLHQNDKLTD